ncbi:class A beta-lactamase [soil metagenome]
MFFRPALLALTLLLVRCGEPPMLGQEDPLFDPNTLTAQFQAVADRAAPGTLGVAVEDLRTGQVMSFNGERRFPLQGVSAAPLGAAVLAEVDAGRLKLDQTVTVEGEDLSPPPSAIADAWPGRKAYTVGELLERAVGDGDNTAADLLMREIGGPGAVTAWLQSRKIEHLDVDRYARQLQPDSLGLASFRADWKGEAAYRAALNAVPVDARRRATLAYLADSKDTATPLGAARFLEALNQNELLTPASTRRLITLMLHSPAAPGRLRAALPDGARLAHMSGTARTDLAFTPAVADIGTYRLKDGRRVAVAVFLSGSSLSEAEQERLIADVGRIVIKAAGKK